MWERQIGVGLGGRFGLGLHQLADWFERRQQSNKNLKAMPCSKLNDGTWEWKLLINSWMEYLAKWINQ
jgi:hypothetical protein